LKLYNLGLTKEVVKVRRRINKKRKIRLIRATIFLAVIICIGIVLLKININIKEQKEIQKGVQAIKNLEDKDVSIIKNTIDGIHNEEEDKKRKDKILDMEKNNNIDYKIVHKNNMFLGDSLVEPLEVYDILDKSSVIAKKGKTVEKAKEDVSEIIKRTPDNIFILLGMNDLLEYTDLDYFINKYTELINSIKEGTPETEIYVMSLTPVLQKASDKLPLLSDARNNEANIKLKNMCSDLEVEYVDIRNIVRDDINLYEPDGIHLIYNFYPELLKFLLKYEVEK
jgi:hypothetical protein